jgi:dolichol kinase
MLANLSISDYRSGGYASRGFVAHALTAQSRDLALELYALIRTLDPGAWREDFEAGARERLLVLRRRVAELLEELQRLDGNRRFAELSDALRTLQKTVEENTAQWDRSRMRESLHAAYEKISIRLRPYAVRLPALRPTNYVRSLFHSFCGITSLILLQYLLTRTQIFWTTSVILTAVVMAEVGRRFSSKVNAGLMRLFAPIAHQHERTQINSASWYALALFLLAVTSSTLACSLAVIVLGFADPMAGFVGRRYGRHRIWAGRSWEGSLTFVVAGMLVSIAVLRIYYPGLSWAAVCGVSALAAVAGAVAEVLSVGPVDDNLSIPLAVSAGATLGCFLLF